MATNPKEQHPDAGKSEDAVDKAVEDSFPATATPANGGTTRLESADDEDVDEDAPD